MGLYFVVHCPEHASNAPLFPLSQFNQLPPVRHQLTLWDRGYVSEGTVMGMTDVSRSIVLPVHVSRGVLAYSSAFSGTHCTYPQKDGQNEQTSVTGSPHRWFNRPNMVTHPELTRYSVVHLRWLKPTCYPLSQTVKNSKHKKAEKSSLQLSVNKYYISNNTKHNGCKINAFVDMLIN